MLKRCVVKNCSNVKKDEVIPVKELLAKVVQVKSLVKSKDGRDYVTTIIKDLEGNETALQRKHLLTYSLFICQDQYIHSIEIVRRIFPREKISVDLLKMAN